MKLNEMLLPEFDQEMALTRKTLERIPEDKFDWKPHEKSMPLGRLAGHLAEMLGWTGETIRKDSLDLAPPGAPPMRPAVVKTRKEVLDLFDKNNADARAALEKATDDHLLKSWSLLMGGKTLMDTPQRRECFYGNVKARDRPYDHKSHGPSPRAVIGFHAAQRHRRTADLRPYGRRRPDVARVIAQRSPGSRFAGSEMPLESKIRKCSRRQLSAMSGWCDRTSEAA